MVFFSDKSVQMIEHKKIIFNSIFSSQKRRNRFRQKNKTKKQKTSIMEHKICMLFPFLGRWHSISDYNGYNGANNQYLAQSVS